MRSSKRMALCLTMSPDVANWLPDTRGFLQEERDGVIVIPLYWEDRTGLWKLPMGGAFVPHENEVSDYCPVGTPAQGTAQPAQALLAGAADGVGI